MNRILTILLLTYPPATLGQLSRGDLMINGTCLLNSESNPNSVNGYTTKTTHSFSVKTSVGVFINKNFELGIQIGYSTMSQNEDVRGLFQPLEFTGYLLSTAIYGQRYFALSRRLYVTVFASTTFNSGTDTYVSKFSIPADLYVSPSRIFQISTSIRPTIIFFLLPRLGVQAGLGSIRYLHSKNKNAKTKQNVTEINYWPITMGLTYYLPKKKS